MLNMRNQFFVAYPGLPGMGSEFWVPTEHGLKSPTLPSWAYCWWTCFWNGDFFSNNTAWRFECFLDNAFHIYIIIKFLFQRWNTRSFITKILSSPEDFNPLQVVFFQTFEKLWKQPEKNDVFPLNKTTNHHMAMAPHKRSPFQAPARSSCLQRRSIQGGLTS